MNVGFVGAGKLGLPVALAVESRGHNVSVYDINPAVEDYLTGDTPYPHQEDGVEAFLADNHIKVAKNIGELVSTSDIVFCAIQTPHEPQFEGSTRLPDERADFDYTYLKRAVVDVAEAAGEQKKQTTLAVISTCLPGTYERDIKPLLNEKVDYVYNPLYIAMGTVVMDYLNPEFVLIGEESAEAAKKLSEFYKTIHGAPEVVTDITTAEGIKVSYNTWITAKTVIANAWGEMCEKLGMNFDDMHKAWSLATDRLISPKYMKAGVADGGSCHPRDNIALSHIANKIGMSHNIWEDLMKAREQHMVWLGMLGIEESLGRKLPMVILGRSFKPESNIETGSASVLLHNIITGFGFEAEHFEDLEKPEPAVYIIGTDHERYRTLDLPEGSVCIDPFRNQPERNGVVTLRIGGRIELENKNGRTNNS